MIDAERIEKLRRALRFAIVCACDGDLKAAALLFPLDELKGIEDDMEKAAKGQSVYDYFKKALEL